MKNWIKFPRMEGEYSRQAHADFPEGTYEREMGREGFFGPATHIYHQHPPTNWIEFDGPLQPRAFDTNEMQAQSNSPMDAKVFLKNAQCKIAIWKTEEKMDHLYRNSDGDVCLFVHEGAGELFCDFGHIDYKDGDYIVIPRGTMWRLEPSSFSYFLMIEATDSAYQLPAKGMVGDHAIFDPAILDHPKVDDAFKAQQDENKWTVKVKVRNQISTIVYPFNPLDAKGWKGDLTLVRVNWRDIRPLMSHRYHLPPSAHTTFVAQGFVICTFAPRPIESDPGALKVPFYHSNDDYDEFIFYHRGEFFSRDNIHPGMTSFHPAGFSHGPHPKAFEAGKKHAKKETDEVAVMIDTRHALEVTDEAVAVEWKDYVKSWMPKD